MGNAAVRSKQHRHHCTWTSGLEHLGTSDALAAREGDKIEALVLDIDPSQERLSLGVKQLGGDPWDSIAQRYPVGSKVKGKVTSIVDFGIFVEIEEGLEGLIHSSLS